MSRGQYNTRGGSCSHWTVLALFADEYWLSAYSPDSQISPHTHLHEPFERSRLHFPTHDHHHLVGQFDVRLPAEVAARGAFKHEAKVWKHRKWQINSKRQYDMLYEPTSHLFLVPI